jgi:uncharacterized protein
MTLNNNFGKIFGKLPIIGMIHLAGDEPVKRALEEVDVLEEEGLDGVIVENYHGSAYDVEKTLEELSKTEHRIALGVNILPNDYATAFAFAMRYNAGFIQLDHVAGSYQNMGSLDVLSYARHKGMAPEVVVLGGVWPKYYTPVAGSNLENDIKTGMRRAEAIVVTGAGTGKETPIEKIMEFKRIAGHDRVIIGAGLTANNAYEQLKNAGGAIVG